MKFAGLDIAEMSRLAAEASWRQSSALMPMAPRKAGSSNGILRRPSSCSASPGPRCTPAVLLDLGLGYLSLDRSTPTLSPGELQRLRLATQVRSNLFGVVYVLDEPRRDCIRPIPSRCCARSTG